MYLKLSHFYKIIILIDVINKIILYSVMLNNNKNKRISIFFRRSKNIKIKSNNSTIYNVIITFMSIIKD